MCRVMTNYPSYLYTHTIVKISLITAKDSIWESVEAIICRYCPQRYKSSCVQLAGGLFWPSHTLLPPRILGWNNYDISYKIYKWLFNLPLFIHFCFEDIIYKTIYSIKHWCTPLGMYSLCILWAVPLQFALYKSLKWFHYDYIHIS